jgi:hypothetical protein
MNTASRQARRPVHRPPTRPVQVVFVQLFPVAGEFNADRYLVDGDRPLSVEDLACRLGLDSEQLAEELGCLASRMKGGPGILLAGADVHGYCQKNLLRRCDRKLFPHLSGLQSFLTSRYTISFPGLKIP